MPDLSHLRHGTIGVPTGGEILIDLRCTKQREDYNRKTLDYSGPHGETANRVGGCDLRRRILQHHPQLCRQGRGALCVVSCWAARSVATFLFEKTSQSCDLDDDILCQDLRYQRRLWCSTDLVEVTGGFRLGHELFLCSHRAYLPPRDKYFRPCGAHCFLMAICEAWRVHRTWCAGASDRPRSPLRRADMPRNASISVLRASNGNYPERGRFADR
jgi:hypothetical protein